MSVFTPVAPAEPRHPPQPGRKPGRVGGGLLDPRQLWLAVPSALRKLNPATLWRNPIMFVVEVGSVLTTVLAVTSPTVFAWLIASWLWLTVLFANLAEFAAQQPGVVTVGTLRAHGVNFVALVTGSAMLLALLNFLPALSLGPLAEGLH